MEKRIVFAYGYEFLSDEVKEKLLDNSEFVVIKWHGSDCEDCQELVDAFHFSEKDMPVVAIDDGAGFSVMRYDMNGKFLSRQFYAM